VVPHDQSAIRIRGPDFGQLVAFVQAVDCVPLTPPSKPTPL
jgi:hypothetical protein